MATTPTPAPPASELTKIENDITWIRAHILICLLAVGLIAGSIIGGISLFESLVEKHDERVAAAQQKAEGVDTATQAALMAQLQQDRAADAARDAAQTTLINTLVSQMQQQHAQTAKQVATDATLDTQAAAARLTTQTKANPGDITTLNESVVLPLPVARTVVTDLDLLPQAQNDVSNLQGQLTAQNTLTTDARSQLSTANQIITADKLELLATVKADNDACNVRVDKQAAKDRKRGFWATLAGIATGVVLRSVL